MGAPEVRGQIVPEAARAALSRLIDAGWPDALEGILADLGGAVGVDRSYIFQNLRGPDGRLWMDLIAEWTALDVRPIFDQSDNHLHPYYPDFRRWIDLLGSGGTLRASVTELPDIERAVLEREGTTSLLVAPVVVGGEWWGHVGFDRCGPRRDWTDEELASLEGLAAAITAAVEKTRSEEDRRLREDRFSSMVVNGPAVTYIDGIDESASTVYMSPQIEALLGYPPEDWYEQPDLWPRLLHPDDRARAIAENARHNETGDPFRLEYRMFARDGRVVWVHDEATMVRDDRGMPRYSHGVIMDISDRKKTEEQVAFQAYHDELTGLPSRAMFEELLELSVARARRHDGAVAVLCVDLDDFRLVNDSLGHQAGDALLQLVADRLREATRETDLVARRGGDQFLLLLADLDREDGGLDGAVLRAESVAQRIQESLAAPFLLTSTELYVTASIGVSLFPDDARDGGALQRNAEAAMYEAKKAGATGYVMSAHGTIDSAAKLQFVTRLRKAVDSQRWVLHYQPEIDLETGRMIGVEGLIRWVEPDGTMVPPNDFIPLAEELGLIEQIGDWVVREVLYQMQAWRELDIDLEVSFNLSPRQFWQPDLAGRIIQEVQNANVDPGRLTVEITESSAMMDPDRSQRILWQLHDAGLSIAIDDFGTGYSSFSRLLEMPVRVLKIDRSFVQNVHEHPQRGAIVTAFLELAQGLGMTSLAEGIETAEELAFLRQRGCRLGQGFYFSRPVPPEEIIAYALGGIPTALTLGSA